MQGKRSNHGNFPLQECKQKQKSTHTTQIIQQKTQLTNNRLAGRVGWDDKDTRLERSSGGHFYNNNSKFNKQN